MALAVVVVASGGVPVRAAPSPYGLPVTVSTNGFGLAVVPVASGGMPVFDTGGTLFGPAVIPANTVLPVITGTTVVGSTLMTSSGTWSGTAATYTYQWQRNSAVSYVTWDTATVANVTLSGGNLVATNTGGGANNQGAKVATASGKTTGKYYFELVWTNLVNAAGFSQEEAVGIAMTSVVDYSNSTGTFKAAYKGSVSLNGSNAGINVGQQNSGDFICFAVDLDARKIWIRVGAAGVWNSPNSGENPATGVGGINIAALTGALVPFTTFGGSGGSSGNIRTAKFGASAFSGAVPSGFTAGWPT